MKQQDQLAVAICWLVIAQIMCGKIIRMAWSTSKRLAWSFTSWRCGEEAVVSSKRRGQKHRTVTEEAVRQDNKPLRHGLGSGEACKRTRDPVQVQARLASPRPVLADDGV